MHAVEDGLDGDIVASRFQDVENAWMRAQITHEEYVKASAFPENADEMDEWLSNMEDVYNDIERKSLCYLKGLKEAEINQEAEVRKSLMHEAENSRINELKKNIEKAKLARKLQYSLFENQVEYLNAEIDEAHPIELSVNAYNLLLSAFEKVERAHIELLGLLENGDGGGRG